MYATSADDALDFCSALMIPGVIEFSMALFFAKLVAYAWLYWLPYYLGHIHYSAEKAALLSNFFDVGGIFGGITAGFLKDKYELPACISFGFLMCSVPSLLVFKSVTQNSDNVYIHIAAMFAMGLCINGPYAFITTAVSADLGRHPSLKNNASATATVTAIIDGTGSIGAALQGVLLGYIRTMGGVSESGSQTGWDYVFYFLVACCGMSVYVDDIDL